MSQPDPIDVHVGLVLRRLRLERALSLDELGRALGITYQQVQKYELGRNRISASRLLRAAIVLAVPVGTFFEGLDAERGEDAVVTTADLEAGHALHRIQHERVQRELRRLIATLGRDPD